MKANLLIVIIILTGIAACKKDEYNTKPQLTFKQVNATNFAPGNLVSFEIEFTDKEGDVQDTFWIQKISKVCGADGSFIAPEPMPKFTPTKNLKGDIQIDYVYNKTVSGYQTLSGCIGKPDSCYFRFWLKDKAQNVSDTITSPTIVLLK